jgi:hypothetical protein
MSADSTKASMANSSMWGIARGLSVHTLIYPLEVVKIRQQCHSSPEKSIQVARALFQKEGISAFYKGLPPQLLKTSIKQAWVWPMITGIPVFIKRYRIGDIPQQALTGLAIATIDAAVTTPLERAKILSAFTGETKFSLNGVYKDGWRGFTTHWAKLSVNWSTFLVAQKHLRDRYRKRPEQALSLPQLAGIGAQVAVIVSLVSAPLDIANTLKQAQNLSPAQLFSGNAFRRLYRGWPLSALSLTIHNIASVIVIDKLGQKSSR